MSVREGSIVERADGSGTTQRTLCVKRFSPVAAV